MNDIDVIIIGAGAAGLEAAKHLGNNEKKVLVLEARNRIGGRVWSHPRWGELGAEFVHGSGTFGLLQGATRTEPCSWSPAVYRLDNKQINDTDIPKDNWQMRMVSKKDRSVTDFLAHSPTTNDTKRTIAKLETENDSACEVGRASANALGRQWTKWGLEEGDYFLPHSYAAVLPFPSDDAGRQLSNVRIALNRPVTSIHWDAGKASVFSGLEVIHAKHVIVTVPLGVLQSGVMRFNNKHPADVFSGINQRQMGNVVKVVIHTDDRLPELGAEGFAMCDSPINLFWPRGDGRLVGWTGGPGTSILPTSHPTLMRELVVASLKQALGRAVAIRRLRVVDWSQDRWSRGAYSWMPVATGHGAGELITPVDGRIWLAGEHTEAVHYATVGGAILSGRRVANEILNSLNRG